MYLSHSFREALLSVRAACPVASTLPEGDTTAERITAQDFAEAVTLPVAIATEAFVAIENDGDVRAYEVVGGGEACIGHLLVIYHSAEEARAEGCASVYYQTA